MALATSSGFCGWMRASTLWPYSYYGQNVDALVQPQKPELVGKATAPD